jgi:Outer membrane protein beta-barrel domain
MKRLGLAFLFALAVSASLPARQAWFADRAAGPSLPSTASVSNPDTTLVPALSLPSATPAFAVPSAALPEAPRAPQFGSNADIGYRWDLAAGYEYVHFESAPFSANLSGVHTSIAYSLNDWFALESGVVAAFGGDVFASGETSKYVLFTGGGRIRWNREPRRWSPWLHTLVGVAHVNPQVAREGKNGFAVQAGGGVDYLINPRLSLRGDADYVHTQLYSDSQNNFQIGVGFVLHF